MEITQGVAALLGAVIGAGSAIFSGLLLERYRARRDVRGTASTLAGDISTTLHMTRVRNYKELFEGLAAQLAKGTDVQIPRVVKDPGEKPEPIIERLIEKIGYLPGDLPERIVRFHVVSASIQLDIVRMAAGELSVPDKAFVIRQDLDLWADNEVRGDQLVIDLRRLARSGFWP